MFHCMSGGALFGAIRGSVGGSALVILLLVPLKAAEERDNINSEQQRIIQRWLSEFSPSTLTPQEQTDELHWFIEAARPYQGMKLKVASEFMPTHVYESEVLAKAFYELTGIHVIHEVTGEADVVNKLSAEMFTKANFYDAYINDSDFIGLHSRAGKTVALNKFMENEGKAVTLPTLDVEDFIGLVFTSGTDGNLYQLPATSYQLPATRCSICELVLVST